MIVYKLGIQPGDYDPEGADWAEWFSNLRDAKRRRRELINANPDLDGHRYGEVARSPAGAPQNCRFAS